MNDFTISISEDDAIDLMRLLENSGRIELFVKVRDQIFAQRERRFESSTRQQQRQQQPAASFEEVERFVGGFFR